MNIVQTAREVGKSPAAVTLGLVALSFVFSDPAYAGLKAFILKRSIKRFSFT